MMEESSASQPKPSPSLAHIFQLSVRDLPKILNMKNKSKAGKYEISKGESNNKIAVSEMIRCGLSELIATALLLFLGCMGCVPEVVGMPIPHHWPALSFGLVILIVIQTFGHISGAHINPAVTIAAVLLGLVKPIMGVIYILGQFVGAFVGFGMLKILIPAEYTATEIFNADLNITEHKQGLCTTALHPKTSIMQGLALETILTLVLILICCAVWDKKNAHNMDSLPLRFGLAITGIAMVAGPYSGSSMNTVRSFSPAFFNNDWNAHWIYWVGPNMGAVIGVFLYKAVFAQSTKQEEQIDNPESIPLSEKVNSDVINNI